MNGVVNRTANDPLTACDGCANNDSRAPEGPSGRNHELSGNDAADPNDDASDSQRRDDRVPTWQKKANTPRPAQHCSMSHRLHTLKKYTKRVRDNHPPPRAEDMARMKLLRFHRFPSPEPFSHDDPRSPSFFFVPDSAAGPSGLPLTIHKGKLSPRIKRRAGAVPP